MTCRLKGSTAGWVEHRRADALTERRARHDLRHQIAQLERRLGELFASAFPRRGIEWTVGAVGGPRVLEMAELERVRDALAVRLHEAQAELERRGEVEEQNRGLVEAMAADPGRYRWVRVSNEDVGEPGCRHWHSRPRWGLIGMLMGWWRVKLSSGCPLAEGLRPPRPCQSIARRSELRRSPSICVSRRAFRGRSKAPQATPPRHRPSRFSPPRRRARPVPSPSRGSA